jgi:hypothetical protein
MIELTPAQSGVHCLLPLPSGVGKNTPRDVRLLDLRVPYRAQALVIAAGIPDQANLMALARPVDADKPFNLFRHASALSRH